MKFDVNANEKGEVELEGKARTTDQIAHAVGLDALESAIRAVVQCAPFGDILRPETYALWNQIDFVFDPREMLGISDAGEVQFTVTDATGRTVREFSVPAAKGGEVAFSWDGTGASGQRLPAGSYGISARHTGSDGKAQPLETYVRGTVESVTVGSDGLFLDLPGLGTVPLQYVLRIS